MVEGSLETIKDRWDTERNKLSVKYPLDELNLYEYYKTLDGLVGEAFFNELKDIITVTQLSYGEVRFVLEKSDAKHSVYGPYLHGIYDNKKLVRYWDNDIVGVTATLDREHVWPKSFLTITSVENTHRNIASDPHNLRAIYKSTNSSRSNRYFNDGSGVIGYIQDDWAYYPGDDHRGDVARILFYMHVRYNEEIFLSNSVIDILNYKDNQIKIDGRIPFGLLDVLLQWHELDPPDEFEVYRNNVIYMYQGNRNPFIDHPEYAEVIFAVESTDGSMVIFAFMNIDYDLNMDDLESKNKEEYFN